MPGTRHWSRSVFCFSQALFEELLELNDNTIQQLLLDPAIRLVTLTGSGGSGKTRLGLEVTGELVERFEGRVYFIALGSINDPAMVPAAIAESMGIRETGGRPFVDLLKHHFRSWTHHQCSCCWITWSRFCLLLRLSSSCWRLPEL